MKKILSLSAAMICAAMMMAQPPDSVTIRIEFQFEYNGQAVDFEVPKSAFNECTGVAYTSSSKSSGYTQPNPQQYVDYSKGITDMRIKKDMYLRISLSLYQNYFTAVTLEGVDTDKGDEWVSNTRTLTIHATEDRSFIAHVTPAEVKCRILPWPDNNSTYRLYSDVISATVTPENASGKLLFGTKARLSVAQAEGFPDVTLKNFGWVRGSKQTYDADTTWGKMDTVVLLDMRNSLPENFHGNTYYVLGEMWTKPNIQCKYIDLDYDYQDGGGTVEVVSATKTADENGFFPPKTNVILEAVGDPNFCTAFDGSNYSKGWNFNNSHHLLNPLTIESSNFVYSPKEVWFSIATRVTIQLKLEGETDPFDSYSMRGCGNTDICMNTSEYYSWEYYSPLYWEDDTTIPVNACRTVDIKSDTTLTIIVEERKADIKVFTDESKGTVSGDGKYTMGDDFTIQATAQEGWYFDHWDVEYREPDGVDWYAIAPYDTLDVPDGYQQVLAPAPWFWAIGKANPYSEESYYDYRFTANYRPLTAATKLHTLTVKGDNTAWAWSGGSGTYEDGEKATAIIGDFYASDYHFAGWSDAPGSVDLYRLLDLTSDSTVTPLFESGAAAAGTIYVEVADGQSDLGEAIVCGNASTYKVVIAAYGKPGYEFDRWDDGSTQQVRIVARYGSQTYTAHFRERIPAGINAVESTKTPIYKIVKDGRLYIIRNGKGYDVTGKRIE